MIRSQEQYKIIRAANWDFMAPQKAWQFNYHSINISGVWCCGSTKEPEVTADRLTGEAGQRVEDWAGTPAGVEEWHECAGRYRGAAVMKCRVCDLCVPYEAMMDDPQHPVWTVCTLGGGFDMFDMLAIIMGDNATVCDFALWDKRRHSLNLTAISKIHFSNLCLQAVSELPRKGKHGAPGTE